MGLFSKKKIPDGIRVLFYDGELPGFSVNGPCQVLLMGSVLRITRVDPYTEVRLDRTQITEIEIYFREQEYMAKYHGVSVSTSRMVYTIIFLFLSYKLPACPITAPL